MTVTKKVKVVFAFFILLQSVQSQGLFLEKRVPPSDFVVMAWGATSSDPVQLQWMKDAGINVAGFAKVNELPAIEKAGMKVFVSDLRASGYDFGRPLDEALVRRNLQSLSKEIGPSPAVMGIDVYDEPNLQSIPNVAIVARMIREYMPGKMPYAILFPIHALPQYVGTKDYNLYVRTFMDAARPPFLAYDNYSLINGYMNDTFFSNLEVIRNQSIASKVPFWNCVLSVAHRNYMENTEATLHLQAYATLAYGGRGIQYYTYYAEPRGNYRLAPIDQFGNKTPSWDMLRRINNQIHALAPTLKKLKSTGVYHYPDVPPEGYRLNESKLVKSVEMSQRIAPQAQGRFLVGEFVDESGRSYLMLVNKDLTQSFRFRIDLHKPEAKLIHISPYSGREEPFGHRDELDWIAPGSGHLFRVE